VFLPCPAMTRSAISRTVIGVAAVRRTPSIVRDAPVRSARVIPGPEKHDSWSLTDAAQVGF
jgi:hypothetical protein